MVIIYDNDNEDYDINLSTRIFTCGYSLKAENWKVQQADKCCRFDGVYIASFIFLVAQKVEKISAKQQGLLSWRLELANCIVLCIIQECIQQEKINPFTTCLGPQESR